MVETLFLFAADMERNAALQEIKTEIISDNIGVGLCESSAGMIHAIYKHNPKSVVFIGSCGSYTHNLQINDVVVAQKITLVSTDFFENKMRLPTLVPQEIDCSLELNKNYFCNILNLENLINSNVANTLGITEKTNIAEKFAELFCVDTENLEAYSVASVCNKYNLPFLILLGVTNHVQENGGKDWLKNYKDVLKDLTKKIIS